MRLSHFSLTSISVRSTLTCCSLDFWSLLQTHSQLQHLLCVFFYFSRSWPYLSFSSIHPYSSSPWLMLMLPHSWDCRVCGRSNSGDEIKKKKKEHIFFLSPKLSHSNPEGWPFHHSDVPPDFLSCICSLSQRLTEESKWDLCVSEKKNKIKAVKKEMSTRWHNSWEGYLMIIIRIWDYMI